MRNLVRIVAAAVLALALSADARAVVYNPDGTTPPYDDWYERRRDLEIQHWPGEVLASRTTPFEIRVYSAKAGRDLAVAGSLTQEVVRETETGYLSFHYRVGAIRLTQDTTDFEGLTLEGFGTYFTDVRSDVRDDDFSLRRLNGGDTFFYWLDDFNHHLVIRTNAPAFDDGGSLNYHVDWDGWGEAGSATVGTFRPVPEPAGLISLGAAALPLRRRRAAVVPPPAAGR
jgi:hypothetical protein